MAFKLVTVVGARPQFIKAAAVSRVIAADFDDRITEVLVHTGQHYDDNMSQVFFDELQIPTPRHNLQIAGGGHGAMTGRMLAALEEVLQEERPDCVLVYGDTNSTLAAALAAVKMHIPVAHVEAGLRSFNMRMPEEVNRILTDRVSSLLFCPTVAAVENLGKEGITRGVHNVGDVMFDVALFYGERAAAQSDILKRLHLEGERFVLATCHRAENTDDAKRLRAICTGLAEVASRIPVVLALHPRTRSSLAGTDLLEVLRDVRITDPLPFLDMVALERNAEVIVTDSGGVQKEAYFYRVPCVTMRDETEWVETVALGANHLVGADRRRIADTVAGLVGRRVEDHSEPYGRGRAASAVLERLLEAHNHDWGHS